MALHLLALAASYLQQSKIDIITVLKAFSDGTHDNIYACPLFIALVVVQRSYGLVYVHLPAILFKSV